MFVINAEISNLAIINLTTMLVSNLPRRQGLQKRVSVLVEKNFSGPQQGADGQKSLHQIGNTLTCRVNWACSVTVNLCNRQIIKVKNTSNIVWPR